MVKQTTGASAGIYGHTWTEDSRYCYVHLYNEGTVEVYDRNTTYTKINSIITN